MQIEKGNSPCIDRTLAFQTCMVKCMKDITVIIPIFNNEKYLFRCIDSVLAQSLTNIEIILACDGPESCDIICENYAAKFGRVKLTGHCGSYGKSVNKAIDMANGDYIGIVEADDWVSPKMFETLYNMARKYDVDICKGAFTCCYDDSTKNTTKFADMASSVFSISDKPELLSSQPSVWSAIYKKDFLNKFNLRFMEDRISYVDSPFQMESFLRASRIALCNSPMYFYNLANPQQSVKDRTKILDSIMADEHLLQRIDILSLSQPLYEHLMLAFIRHLVWHYNRFSHYAEHKIFWEAAHSFLLKALCRPYDSAKLSLPRRVFFFMLRHCDSYWKAAATMAAATIIHKLRGQKSKLLSRI